MEDKEIKTEVLNKIKSGDFKPKARWRFLLIDWLWWMTFALSVILGGLVLAAAISSLAKNDWHLYRQVMDLKISDIFSGIPLFWLVGLLLFAWLAKKQIYLTRAGYRLSTWRVLGLSLSISLFLGSLIFFVGAGDQLENYSARFIPYYNILNSTNSDFWFRPERGVMEGEILAVADSDNLLVRDVQGLQWIVLGEDIEWVGGQVPKIGSFIRIVGSSTTIPGASNTTTANRVFEARQIQLIRP